MENKTIGTSYMYLNETINSKHHVTKSTNNNKTKNYGACMKRKRNTSVIVCLINNVIYLLSVRQSGFHPLPISKIKQTGGGFRPTLLNARKFLFHLILNRE